MRLTEDDLVYYTCRTRLVDDVPYVVEYTYMPVEVIPGINQRVLKGSIYSHILDTLQLKPQSAHRTIRAVLPTEQEKKYFQTEEPMALLDIPFLASVSGNNQTRLSRQHLRLQFSLV